MGINHLLGSPCDTAALIPYAMEGEKIASGSTHADNIAPALLGGIKLIRGYDPLDIKHIPYPSDLWCAVVHPDLEIKIRTLIYCGGPRGGGGPSVVPLSPDWGTTESSIAALL